MRFVEQTEEHAFQLRLSDRKRLFVYPLTVQARMELTEALAADSTNGITGIRTGPSKQPHEFIIVGDELEGIRRDLHGDYRSDIHTCIEEGRPRRAA